jgi:O-methyltransferase
MNENDYTVLVNSMGCQRPLGASITNEITMISKDRFDTIYNNKEYLTKLEGDVVECGVWRGGMGIFLTKLFINKNIWLCDSYEGCQDPKEGKYYYENERHYLGQYKASLDEVIQNFRNYNALDENRVKFLKGWVRDTLKPETCPINKISLLRVDVDAYSATLEVLDYLYDKVVSGGMIIFDDICLDESREAVKHFLNIKNITILKTPSGELIDKENFSFPCGCYILKKD